MKIGSLFDGSGGFPLAASMCGIEPVWASEVEPYPIAVTSRHFPGMKHLGDVSRVNGGMIDPVDVITFGSPCFPAGTLVLTEHGYENIENLKVGDRVFTHKGNWKQISAVGYKLSQTVILKGNHYGLEATPNHPFYSAEVLEENGQKVLCNKGEWTAAERMDGKRWAVPNEISGLAIPGISRQNAKQNNPPEISVDLMYFLGRWLGDGWLRDGQRAGRPKGQTFSQIVICANREESEYLEKKIRNVFPNVRKSVERTVNKFIISNQTLCKWIRENFGVKAHGKSIPGWAYCMRESLRMALLQGYLDSDGYRFSQNTWKATTVSKKLAHGIRLLAETLGYSGTVHFSDTPRTTVIEGRNVNQRPMYQIVITKSQRKLHIIDGPFNWYICKSVEQATGHKVVYNITVEGDHSYIVEGFVVHNCQDMSMAGKRKGIQHKEHGAEETTRSGLFYEAVRIIEEMREATNGAYPAFAVWENVFGAFSSNKGEDFRAVLRALIQIVEPGAVVPSVPKGGWAYADCWMGDGWSIGWRTFDAQYWGVPQRRRRVYLVLDLRGQRAGKILFERPGLRRDFKTGRAQGQGTSADAAGSPGVCDCV